MERKKHLYYLSLLQLFILCLEGLRALYFSKRVSIDTASCSLRYFGKKGNEDVEELFKTPFSFTSTFHIFFQVLLGQ